MKSEARAKQLRVALDTEEASLRTRLLALLPGISGGGAQLFLNSANSLGPIARWSHEDADALFASAMRCVELRKSLGLEGESHVAGYFFAACREAAGGDAHRRGPRQLAAWLLAKLTRASTCRSAQAPNDRFGRL
jgi:hypothetical protein